MISFTERAAVEALAREAGALALEHFAGHASLAVDAKGPLDLVTEADRAVEALLARRLAALFPDDGVFGEEGAATAGRSGRTWVVDPIDGTFNFVRRGDQWAVSIGLHADGVPRFGVIYAPVRDQLFSGGDGLPATLDGAPLPALGAFDPGRGSVGVGLHPAIPATERAAVLRTLMGEAGLTIRCCGSATISLMEVATGQVDGYVGMGESTWDVMAALPILTSLGAKDTLDWSNVSLRDKLRFVTGSADLFARLPNLARLFEPSSLGVAPVR